MLLEEKDYVSGVKVVFLLTRYHFMKKSSEKETEKSKACNNYVRCKEEVSTLFHKQA